MVRPEPPPNPSNRVLRYAVILGSRVIEDRTLASHQSVTFGSHTRNTIVVPGAEIPSTHPLFGFRDGQYCLRIDDTMGGRIATLPGAAKVDLASLRDAGAAPKRGKYHEVQLNPASRGSVVVGEATVLFQFVNPPKVAARPAMPASKGAALKSLDTTFVLSLIGLLGLELSGAAVLRNHHAAAGSDDELALATAEDLTAHTPPPTERQYTAAVEEMRQRMRAVPHAASAPPGPSHPTPKPVAQVTPHPHPVAGPNPTPRRVTNQDASGMGLLAVLGANRAAIGNEVLPDSNSAQALADNLKGAQQRSGSPDSLVPPTRRGVGPGARVDSADLRTDPATSVAMPTRIALPLPQLKVNPEIRPEVSGKLDRDALARFVTLHLPAIQRCYEHGLKRDHGLEGRIQIRFTIGSSGSTEDVEIEDSTLQSADIEDCVRRTISRWTTPFHPTQDVAVSYPFIFSAAT